MLLGLFSFMVWVVIDGRRTAAENNSDTSIQQPGNPDSLIPDIPVDEIKFSSAIFWLLFGLFVLVFGANILVNGSATVARSFGVSDAVIGLTIVAIGTSLPELAASIAGALKGEPDMAIGNVIGSNIFNLLGVIGIAGVLTPMKIDPEIMLRDYPIMLLITGLLLAFCLWQGRGKSESMITRVHGVILLGIYVVYQVTIVYQSLHIPLAV